MLFFMKILKYQADSVHSQWQDSPLGQNPGPQTFAPGICRLPQPSSAWAASKPPSLFAAWNKGLEPTFFSVSFSRRGCNLLPLTRAEAVSHHFLQWGISWSLRDENLDSSPTGINAILLSVIPESPFFRLTCLPPPRQAQQGYISVIVEHSSRAPRALWLELICAGNWASFPFNHSHTPRHRGSCPAHPGIEGTSLTFTGSP